MDLARFVHEQWPRDLHHLHRVRQESPARHQKISTRQRGQAIEPSQPERAANQINRSNEPSDFRVPAEHIAQKIRQRVQEVDPKVVAVDLSAVFDLEYTALKMLADAEKRNRVRGIRLWLVGMNPEVLSMIQKSSLGEALGREGMYFNLETAVTKYLSEASAKRLDN